jgi:hypothetical protein
MTNEKNGYTERYDKVGRLLPRENKNKRPLLGQARVDPKDPKKKL